MARITIVGAGVVGLAIAAQLSRMHDITIIAKNLPGDKPTLEWASPWAGANFVAGYCTSPRDRKMQRDTFIELWSLASRYPESSVKMIPMEEFFDKKRTEDDLWFKDFVPDFRLLTEEELPDGAKGGYTTIVLNPNIFLVWMRNTLETSGVRFKRLDLHALSDARHLGHDVLINASGLGPRNLVDIQDPDMLFLKGQIILVKSDYNKCMMRDDGKDYTYVIPRLDGTVIIGGIRDPDTRYVKTRVLTFNTTNRHFANSDMGVDRAIDKDITRRVNKSLPAHFSADPADYNIVGHNVGIRPYRSTGMRIEKEIKNGQNIIHAYGITGGGYIFGFGVAREVAKLVDEFLYPAGKHRL
ncbi:d-amino-acid oxidase [Fusarium pseudocircinatum]|uniref:D-amino-acid oxidase n=1 Tax=Fusarium pseudocircinatum TaxID=56676 RepID=A0A8H5PKX4_9HYPO|nr:d-amino-acid oxidase [Fusarium pseudocircinatum]